MKQFILFTCFSFTAILAKAQVIDSIYVNLYTDSLKKGTFNYINVDGLLRNGRYLPLDSTHLIFEASGGRFSGNSLWIEKDFAAAKVHVKVTLRRNKLVAKEFDMYIKQYENTELLKTNEQILNDVQRSPAKKKRRRG